MPGPYQTPGVYIEEIPAGSKPIQGVGTAVAAFIGFTFTRPKDNTGQPVFIASWNQFVEKFCTITREVEGKVVEEKVEIYVDGFLLPHAVYGYFNNGGRSCYVQSLVVVREAEQPAHAASSVQLLTQKDTKALELRSAIPGIVIEIGDATGADVTEDQFKASIKIPGQQDEELPNLTMEKQPKGSAKNAVAELRKIKGLTVTEGDTSGTPIERRPKNGRYHLSTALSAPPANAETFKGNVTERSGLGAFEEILDVTMLVCPDLMSVYLKSKRTDADREAVALVQNAMLAHCAQMKDRFAILDPLPDLSVEDIYTWRMKGAGFNKDDGKYGALYYPWIYVANPLARNGDPKSIAVPPSGHIAGVYARVDQTHGVHKAPANEAIRGAIKLERLLIDSEQAKLNPEGINCIRAFPGRGILIWGARTLTEAASEWRYINIRRLFNYLEESIYEGTQWVVFEPNDMDLWERVKRTITAFLTTVWRDGALFGATPEEAFYVKCDADLNPPARRNNGELIVEVGVAPVMPAEFVIFRFKQMSGGGELSE